jgi:hypothetical protein
MKASHLANANASGSLVWAAALSAALVSASLSGLVWVRVQSQAEGYRTHTLRTAVQDAEQRGAALKVERAQLLRPGRLASLARVLGLDAPSAEQVIDVSASAGGSP